MKAVVDVDACTGCGLCVDECPEVFEMDGEVAKAKVSPVPKEYQDSCRAAAEGCPVDAISIAE